MDERRRIEFNENYDNKLKAKLARIEKRFDDKDQKATSATRESGSRTV